MPVSLQWPDKDPGEELDYALDWTARLTTGRVVDTISSSTWSVSPSGGVTVTASSTQGAITTVWLDGGQVGQTYTITNTIVTAGNRTMVQSIQIRIASR